MTLWRIVIVLYLGLIYWSGVSGQTAAATSQCPSAWFSALSCSGVGTCIVESGTYKCDCDAQYTTKHDFFFVQTDCVSLVMFRKVVVWAGYCGSFLGVILYTVRFYQLGRVDLFSGNCARGRRLIQILTFCFLFEFAGYFGGYSFLTWGDTWGRESTASSVFVAIGSFFTAPSTCALLLRFVELSLVSVTFSESNQKRPLRIMQRTLIGACLLGILFFICVLGTHFVEDFNTQKSFIRVMGAGIALGCILYTIVSLWCLGKIMSTIKAHIRDAHELGNAIDTLRDSKLLEAVTRIARLRVIFMVVFVAAALGAIVVAIVPLWMQYVLPTLVAFHSLMGLGYIVLDRTPPPPSAVPSSRSHISGTNTLGVR